MRHRSTWIIIGCCLLGLIHSGMVCNTLGLYYTSLAAEFEISMTRVTLIMSFLVGGGLVGIMFAGKLLHMIPTRVLLSFAVVIVGGGLLISSCFESIYLFYAVWGAIGFCSPLLISVTIPTILGNWFEEKLGSVMGIVYGVAGIGGTLFNPVTGWLLENYGFRTALQAEGVITLTVLLPITLFVLQLQPKEQKNIEHKAAGSAVKKRKKHYWQKAFLLFVCASILLTIVNNLQQQISTHVQNIGFSISFASNVMAAVLLGCAVGNLVCGMMFDRMRPVPVLICYALCGLLGWLGLAAAGVLLHPGIPVLLLLSGFLIGMGHALFQIGIPFCVRRVYGGAEYSQIFAAVCLPGSAVGIFAAPLGGVFYDVSGSYQGLVVLLSILSFAGGLSIIGALKAKKQSAAGTKKRVTVQPGS